LEHQLAHHVVAKQDDVCQGHGTSQVDRGWWLVIGFYVYLS
jgi:hypothetical protein